MTYGAKDTKGALVFMNLRSHESFRCRYINIVIVVIRDCTIKVEILKKKKERVVGQLPTNAIYGHTLTACSKLEQT